jgi:hypothetical protein
MSEISPILGLSAPRFYLSSCPMSLPINEGLSTKDHGEEFRGILCHIVSML